MKEEVEVVKCELAESLSSHQYQTYIVDLQHKLWTKTQVQLGGWSSCGVLVLVGSPHVVSSSWWVVLMWCPRLFFCLTFTCLIKSTALSMSSYWYFDVIYLFV